MYYFEKLELREQIEADPSLEQFPDIGTAVWFMLVTFSTVGYGDVSPDSQSGTFEMPPLQRQRRSAPAWPPRGTMPPFRLLSTPRRGCRAAKLAPKGRSAAARAAQRR